MSVTNVLATLADNPPGSFLSLDTMNDAAFGACDITGVSPVWEMHPDTDEFFYVIEGRLEFTLLDGDSPSERVVHAGEMTVVPRGIWHRPGAPDGAKFIYYTPGQSLHSDAEDPRTTEA